MQHSNTTRVARTRCALVWIELDCGLEICSKGQHSAITLKLLMEKLLGKTVFCVFLLGSKTVFSFENSDVKVTMTAFHDTGTLLNLFTCTASFMCVTTTRADI